MEKHTKRIWLLSIFGAFAFVFSLQFVAAANLNPIKDWFANWENAQLSANVVKYFFWALISMLVYSIGSKIPFFSGMFESKKEWLGGTFSVIVGFLSMAYITPPEVIAMMTSYSAMGFVLGGALPFIILASFTFTLATSEKDKPAQTLMNKAIAWLMWVAFLIFIGYKILPTIGTNVTNTYVGFLWVIFAANIIIIFAFGYLWNKIGEMVSKEELGEVKKIVDQSANDFKLTSEHFENILKKNNLGD